MFWGNNTWCRSCARVHQKLKHKHTWMEFFLKRWESMNKRTINGSAASLIKPPPKARDIPYLRRGTELRITRDEFKSWCFSQKDVIESIWQRGEVPSIDRIDHHGHYELGNLQVLTWAENSTKDSPKRMS